MDIRAHNEAAWDKQVEWKNRWTIPVSRERVARARRGDVGIVLTANEPVPEPWLGDLRGADVLGLAAGGGQQGPLLAAAGARVTIFDNSSAQLAQDQLVGEREGLEISTVKGTMTDLSIFPDASFDLVVNPVSVVFCSDVTLVWREVARVLRPGGALLAGFGNPSKFVFDLVAYEKEGRLDLTYSIPYSDAAALSAEEVRDFEREGEPLLFSHTLTDLIGGQLRAGLVLMDLYEDSDGPDDLLSTHMPTYIATRAIKPGG